ncbi:AAA family ATPase [Mycoplasma sp. CSL7475-4]|uniref:AAA family ATPase n=1 Tax=Mycoplasma sp. CSL7475-4 TaxID=2973942 RepID=UPI00216B109E|nr:AAA family ATPase [Mycoplasma sp. CSL7475-4]MCS4536770.1 AAA family ATPase [Mycoplasma sp. CSL7475-4]
MKEIKIMALVVEKFNAIVQNQFKTLTSSIQRPFATGPNASGKSTKLSAITYLFNNTKTMKGVRNAKDPKTELFALFDVFVNGTKNEFTISYQNGGWQSIHNNGPVGALKPSEYKKFMNLIYNDFWEFWELLSIPDYFTTLAGSEQRTTFINFMLKANVAKFIAPELFNVLTDGKTPDEMKKELRVQKREFLDNMNSTWLFDLRDRLDNTQELQDAVDLVVNKYIKEYSEGSVEIMELDKKLTAIANLENAIVRAFIALVKNKFAGSDFTIELVDGRDGNDSMVIKTISDGVEYKNLNTTKQLEIALQFALMFQELADVKTFLLIDNFERVDANNSDKIEKMLLGHQVLVAKVTNE